MKKSSSTGRTTTMIVTKCTLKKWRSSYLLCITGWFFALPCLAQIGALPFHYSNLKSANEEIKGKDGWLQEERIDKRGRKRITPVSLRHYDKSRLRFKLVYHGRSIHKLNYEYDTTGRLVSITVRDNSLSFVNKITFDYSGDRATKSTNTLADGI